MTIHEIANDIRNKLRGGRATENDYISLDQIKYNIDHYRGLLLHRDIRQDKDVSQFEQELTVSFTKFKENFYDGTVQHIEFLISEPLPSYINLVNRQSFQIYDKHNFKIIPVVNEHRLRYDRYNRYGRSTKAYIRDNKIYIGNGLSQLHLADIIRFDVEPDEHKLSVKAPEEFIIRGVFEFPREVMIRNGEDELEVDHLPYPITTDVTQRITEGIVKQQFDLLQIPADITQDNLPNQ